MKSKVVGKVAENVGVERAVALYGLVLGLGEDMVVLDGTKRVERMVGDLEGVVAVEKWAVENREEWEGIIVQFKCLIGEGEDLA